MKLCGDCGVEKPLSEFGKDVSRRDGKCFYCKSCTNTRTRAYYARHPTKQREQVDRRRAADPVRYNRVYRNGHLKRKFGITLAEFERLSALQGGACAICGKTGKPLWVDHNHVTGAVRGLLCNGCNVAIGLLGDGPELVSKALAYLR